MREKIRNNRKLQAWTILSFATAFLLCVFAPMEAYYANLDQYWFSLGQLLSVCLPVFLIVFFALSAAALLLCGRKAGDAAFAVLLMLFVYFYIQGNYIPRDYGVLNGRGIDWGAYPGYAAASIVLLAACAAAGLLLYLRFRDQMPRVGSLLCIFVLLIQLVTLTALVIQKGIKRQEEGLIVTQEKAFALSKDSNLIVFLLDTYDAVYFHELLETDGPRQEEIFENFTWYPDTLSAYPTTRAAMPQILTGAWYENAEPYEDFTAAAWEENPVYQALTDQDYRVAIYTEPFYLSGDETMYENTEYGQYRIADRAAFARCLWRLVFFNYMPHQLKASFVVDSEAFSELKAAESGVALFSPDVVTFVRRFEEEGLSATYEGNCFRFYHLNGTHDPATFGRALQEDGAGYTAADEAAGNNEFLSVWFDAMKEAGIYDRATIVIMADHGHLNYDQNPIFLIKNAGERHAFTVSQEEMSYEYLPQIWEALAEGRPVDEGFILACQPEYGKRRFLYYSWDDAWKRSYMPGMEEMLCDGPASEPESLKATGRSFVPNGENHEYRLGTELEFRDGRSAYPYVLYGFSHLAMMSDARMAFDIQGDYGNLVVEIEAAEDNRPVPISVYAGERMIAECQFLQTGEMNRLFIPKDCVEDGHLELRFRRTDIGTDIAALTPSKVMFRRMKLSAANREGDIAEQILCCRYEPGMTVGFATEDASGLEYVRSGFSYPEKIGTWTEDREASLRFRLPEEQDGDLLLRIAYSTFDGAQRVQLSANGTEIADFTAAEAEEREIPIPASCREGERLDLRFRFPDAHSPASAGESADERELALLLYSLQIVPAA